MVQLYVDIGEWETVNGRAIRADPIQQAKKSTEQKKNEVLKRAVNPRPARSSAHRDPRCQKRQYDVSNPYYLVRLLGGRSSQPKSRVCKTSVPRLKEKWRMP